MIVAVVWLSERRLVAWAYKDGPGSRPVFFPTEAGRAADYVSVFRSRDHSLSEDDEATLQTLSRLD